ncbi:uncharacterized protein [Sinocyclocheilus grahami]|uniref:uncharacterized protein isoform X2 n=1 Tax=Sinocyclocheilus grahami TaxID=75366 RepID=UPI0007AD11A1|nr:PREDICTED: uncharacterized protein LOC107556699 isoform X2 [Sinocyclocheilus grahami]
MQQMEIFRASVTLLSLCLFHSSLSETQSMCKGNLPPVHHVALNSSVTVPCPVLSAPEMVFRLYKGSEEIFFISVNNTIISKNDNSPRMDFTVNVADNGTSFILDGVTINTTALYTCEAERIFPPPFQQVEHKPQTIVFVEDQVESNGYSLQGQRMQTEMAGGSTSNLAGLLHRHCSMRLSDNI